MDREVLDRIVKEIERRHLTGVSRTQWWRLEQKEEAPSRLRIGSSNSVGWRLSDLMQWIRGLTPVAGCSKSAPELRSKSMTVKSPMPSLPAESAPNAKATGKNSS